MPKIIRPTFEKMTEFRKYARYPFVPDTELKKKILRSCSKVETGRVISVPASGRG